MQTLVSLNDLYMQFVSGLLSRNELEGLIFMSLREDSRYCPLSRFRADEREDYLSWLYPHISRAVDLYYDRGASFDSYIAGVVKWSLKAYRSHEADHSVTEYAAWTARFSEQYTAEEEPEYNAAGPVPAEPEPAVAVRKARNSRQLLTLVLKCYDCVSGDFLERIAPRLGIGKEQLKQMIEKMEKLRLEQDRKLYLIRERIHCQYYRCIVYEKRLAAMPDNSACALKMKSRLERARGRLSAMRKRYAAMHCGATNNQVAEVLGLSKGAVDANLYALKKRWNSDPDGYVLN